MGKRKTQFGDSLWLNKASFDQYYTLLSQLAMASFDWVNVPDSVNIRWLELTLFKNGQCVFFNDEVMGYLALQDAIAGPLNVYDEPTRVQAYASNGYNRKLTNAESVIIYNNLMHTNSMLDIELFSRRLANIDRAIDVNANAQKTPILVLCDETQRLSMLNLYKEYDGNVPFIFGDKSLNPKALSVLNTDAPFVGDKLFELKSKIYNEALTYLGITNLSIEKRERLITDEVLRSQGGTIACRFSRLEARREACKKINKMFGLNIWCNFREEMELETAEEGDTNE